MAELRTSFFLPGHAKQRLCEMPIALQVYAKKQDKASNQINVAACPFGSAGPLFSSFSVLKRAEAVGMRATGVESAGPRPLVRCAREKSFFSYRVKEWN